MKTIITLAGLISIEKAQLSAELANYYSTQGRNVLLLDGIRRIMVEPEWVYNAPVQRLESLGTLETVVMSTPAELIVFAAPETTDPDDLLIALYELDDVRLVNVGMIDLRTCDCFPHIRATLEASADLVVYLPYDLARLVTRLDAPLV